MNDMFASTCSFTKNTFSAWSIIPIILSVRSCYTLYIYFFHVQFQRDKCELRNNVTVVDVLSAAKCRTSAIFMR